jgi:hypothetical protein
MPEFESAQEKPDLDQTRPGKEVCNNRMVAFKYRLFLNIIRSTSLGCTAWSRNVSAQSPPQKNILVVVTLATPGASLIQKSSVESRSNVLTPLHLSAQSQRNSSFQANGWFDERV